MVTLLMLAALASGAPAPTACKGAPPRHECLCLCAPSQTRAGGLTYLCGGKHWYCPRPAAPVKPAPAHPAHTPGHAIAAPQGAAH